jgi:hypothetical protein
MRDLLEGFWMEVKWPWWTHGPFFTFMWNVDRQKISVMIAGITAAEILT